MYGLTKMNFLAFNNKRGYSVEQNSDRSHGQLWSLGQFTIISPPLYQLHDAFEGLLSSQSACYIKLLLQSHFLLLLSTISLQNKKNKDYCINIYYINKNNRHIKCIIIEIFYRELHILNGPRNCYFLKTRAVVRSYNRVWFPCGFEFWKTFGYVQIYSDII